MYLLSRKIYPVVIVLLGASFLFGCGESKTPQQDPFDVRTVALHPSAEFLNPSEAIEYYEHILRKKPETTAAQVALAQLYLQQARATGDETTYVPQAHALLNNLLNREPAHFHARVLQGVLLNKLHDFEQARTLAEALIEEKPTYAFSYGILVDALTELGEYDAAVAACDQMVALKPSLEAYARVSYLRELHGDTDGAIAAMRLAADAGVSGHANRAWALDHLAQLYIGDNQLDVAAYLFEGILEERPDYAPAYAGKAHLARLAGDYATAIRWYRDAYALSPSVGFLEGLEEACALAEEADCVAEAVAGIQEGFAEERRMGGNVDMEFADFSLDHDGNPVQALRYAEANYERRPQHLHTLETYAWALHHNGRAAEALPYIQKAMRLGTGDAMVAFRAGRICQAIGDVVQARAYLQEALDNQLHIESQTAAYTAQAALQKMAP